MRRNYGSTNKVKKKRKVRHSKDDAISESELQLLIKESKNEYDKEECFNELLITLSGYQGMRESEIAHMHKSWVNFQKDEITIPSKEPCKIIKGKPCSECRKERDGIWSPKTDEGARKIPIRIQAREVIRSYFEAHRNVGCTRQTVYNHIIEVADKVQLTKKIYPHSLRATASSLWGKTGVTAGALCRIMGWKNITSANPYVTADEEESLREAKRKDRQYYGDE